MPWINAVESEDDLEFKTLMAVLELIKARTKVDIEEGYVLSQKLTKVNAGTWEYHATLHVNVPDEEDPNGS